MKAHAGTQTQHNNLPYQGLPTISASGSPQNSTSSSPTSQIRKDIQEESWYKRLLASLYILSFMILAITTFVFAADGGGANFVLGGGRLLVVMYIEWILVDIAILFLATLMFIDHNIQAAWKRCSTGKFFSRRIVSRICWGFVVFFISLLSLIFYLITEIF